MRRIVACVLAAGVASVLPACANKDDQTKTLRAAISRTQHLPHRFVYSVKTPDGLLDVQGIVEDDFRFKARVAVGGTPAYDEVVHDDALAVRFADAELVSDYVRTADAAAAFAPTDFSGVTVRDALSSRRWVLDRGGAPAVAPAAAADAKQGLDPVLDALTILDYVRRAADQGFTVKLFDPEDLNPTYRASEDTFPKPQKGSGVQRYDVAKPFLPAVAALGAGGESVLVQTKHFRRIAIYVKDGRIIDVREATDLRGRTLDDFIKYYRAVLKESKAPRVVVNEYERLVRTSTREELSIDLLLFLNEGLKRSGLEPIVVREMSLELRELGSEQSVALPDAGVVRGSLKALRMSRTENEEAKAQDGEEPAADTTTPAS